MIHPHTRIRYINDTIGYGVFATRQIPKGTIVYVKDPLEREISPGEYARHTPSMQAQIEKYTYRDERGVYILSWDFAKYINHCCKCNTLSCAYGCDVVIRDIEAGEEITCDYGILNVEKDMALECKQPHCRGVLKPSDFEDCIIQWDARLKLALLRFVDVSQPLLGFMDQENVNQLLDYLCDTNQYLSVAALRYYPPLIDHQSNI